MALKSVQFLAILLMALALIPAGAHFFALPNKLGLTRDAYFTVQGAGWALFGVVLVGGLIVNLVLAIMLRHDRLAFIFALIGFLALAATLAIFFVWVFPANQATANWTEIQRTGRLYGVNGNTATR
jgi:hypothetical protein